MSRRCRIRQPIFRDRSSGQHTKAETTVRESDSSVAVGYSFGQYDHASYRRPLDALCESAKRKLLIVSPDARVVPQRLRREFPCLVVTTSEGTFKQWVEVSYPEV